MMFETEFLGWLISIGGGIFKIMYVIYNYIFARIKKEEKRIRSILEFPEDKLDFQDARLELPDERF